MEDNPEIRALLIEAALLKIPELKHGKPYPAKQICAVIWHAFDEDTEKQTAGSIFKRIVLDRKLPLLLLDEKTGSNWLQYELL
jgi:hypothetical protein